MKIDTDIEFELDQALKGRRYDPLLIASFGMIAFSVVIIAMTVTIMIS